MRALSPHLFYPDSDGSFALLGMDRIDVGPFHESVS